MVEYLVEMKANINAKNKLGHTPRQTALRSRKKDWTRLQIFKTSRKKTGFSALL